MHRWQQHAERGENKHPAVENALDAGEAQPLEESRRELDPEHDDIGHYAQRDFEHHRVRLDVPGQQQVIGVPVTAEIEDHGEAAQRIAEQAAEQRRPHQRMVLAAIEDVDQERHGETATAEGGADDYVYDDPDSPRVARVDVGDGAEAEKEPYSQEIEGDDDQRDEHQRGRCYQTSAQWCGGAHGQT